MTINSDSQEAAMPVIHEVATITSKGHITTLPDDLARSMLAALGKRVDLNEDIEGDVAL